MKKFVSALLFAVFASGVIAAQAKACNVVRSAVVTQAVATCATPVVQTAAIVQPVQVQTTVAAVLDVAPIVPTPVFGFNSFAFGRPVFGFSSFAFSPVLGFDAFAVRRAVVHRVAPVRARQVIRTRTVIR